VSPQSEVWWTDPIGSDNCIQADLNAAGLTIWQYSNGNITSVEIARPVARDIAAWILTATQQTEGK